jgi:ATP/maltotriose-dependent transcriptional regulator MalT
MGDDVTAQPSLAAGAAALAAGRWEDARTSFEDAVATGETGEGHFGLAAALWWLGENHGSVAHCTRAYSLFRRSGESVGAVQCALWLGIVYKANFANFAAANGWISRADRLLESLDQRSLHAQSWVARAYRMVDLRAAEELTGRALAVARAADDVDVELTALSQLGLIRVGQGETAAGFAMIDEAMAAALGGERSTLDTVVYTCCDMLNACELAGDVERAAQWCAVADDFVQTYGCPFLYAECRIYYGSVLTAKGRWDDAAEELLAGLRITDRACPGLHGRALSRLAGLRVRQGRLEEADELLDHVGHDLDAEAEASLWRATLLLARGDAPAASRALAQRLHDLADHRMHLAGALDLLVDAHITAGDHDAADAAAERLSEIASGVDDEQLGAMAAAARGRVAIARGDLVGAAGHLRVALRAWSGLDRPFEVGRTRFELARALAAREPDAAVDEARRALTAFAELGASVDADRAAAFLRSAGIVPRVGPKGVGVLTAREREVLRLVGAGLSNPEIAQRLHVSRKTASHHVSSILAKLNVRNRAEAAAQAVAILGPTGDF